MAQAAQAQNKIVRWNGLPARLDKLPPVSTTRWVIRRKAAVVDAVTTGLISLEEACRRYTLSVEEFQSWVKAMDKHGRCEQSGGRAASGEGYRSTEIRRGEDRCRNVAYPVPNPQELSAVNPFH